MNFTRAYENLDKIFEEMSTYYRVEVFDNQNELRGGLFRGVGALLKDLWYADDEHYDYINEPLSRLEYKTPYPNNLDNSKIKFAYKHNFWIKNIEDFKNLEAELNNIGWSMSVLKISRPTDIVYEDDTQIAFIPN